jgi:DNA repair exonuclease SbcCD nuclease subunit
MEMLWLIAQRVPLYIIVGNHDRPNNSVYLTDQHPFNACKHWPNTIVVDVVKQDLVAGHLFTFVPYVPPGRFREALETLEGTEIGLWQSSTCIFAHQEFQGTKMGAIVSEEGDEWPLDLPLVVSGHIHDYDYLQKNIVYTGTPIQHAFGDRSDKTVSLFTFMGSKDEDSSTKPAANSDSAEKGWHEERIDLQLPKKIILRIAFKDIESTTIPPQSEVKVIISGQTSEIKTAAKLATIKRWKAEGVKVVYRDISEISFDEEQIGVTLTFEQVMLQMLEKLPLQERQPLLSLFHEITREIS